MEDSSDQRTGSNHDLLHPFQFSFSLDADSRGVICGRATKPISRERMTMVKIECEVVHYKFCAMGYGRYCQIHEEDSQRNNLAA